MRTKLDAVLHEVNQVLLGKEPQVRLALTCLLARGHLLIEDLPGMGKTTLSQALARVLGLSYQRIQFTSDLLPGDILGTSVFDKDSGQFVFHPGPIFAELVLADEINRATPKSQSALLEAMEEGQVTIEGATRPLPEPFFVIATQNPVSSGGTFALPESQLDRFLMHVRIGYPEASAEAEILRLARERARETLHTTAVAVSRMPLEDVFAARSAVLGLHVAPQLERYMIELVLASRDAARYDPSLARRIAWGASPRGSIALERCARARAWLAGRDFVTPDDVRAIAADVLRHRVLPSYEATAEGWDGDRLVAALLDVVPLP